MATRKMFFNNTGESITPYLDLETEELVLEIKEGAGLTDPNLKVFKFSKIDAEELIIELYKLKKKFPK